MKSKLLPSFLPPYTTQEVNKLSLGLGILIGPGTVVSNVIKLVNDVAKIVFYSFRNIYYVQSKQYKNFKKLENEHKEKYSAKFRPIMVAIKTKDKISFKVTTLSRHYHDQDHFNFINHVNNYHYFLQYEEKFNKLSKEDRCKLALDHAVDDVFQHISYIGVGIIRTIPVLGAASILIYKEFSKTVGSPNRKHSEHCKACQVAR